ncbi:MAG TPA: tryptophan synthase subunit alpha [Planctomycetota bacterium]|nr:tryptophan synthase subunit alpha [Planctomycetota bacterium]
MTLAETFERLKQSKRAAFIPFFAAGDPDIATTSALIKAAAASGADIIEIGVPFSDPIADGPVIQAAFYRALDKGFKVAQLFEMVKALRAGGLQTPLVCMVSYTLVYKRSLDAFLKSCKDAGFSGLIIPDLPAGYEGDAAARAAAAGLDLIFLVAPTTTPERREIIARRSKGFIYYISVTGITGARIVLPEDLGDNVKDLQHRTSTPVCVGFGISRPEQAAAVSAVADGVIVGSALVKKVEEALSQKLSGDALVQHVNTLLKSLADAAHSGK